MPENPPHDILVNFINEKHYKGTADINKLKEKILTDPEVYQKSLTSLHQSKYKAVPYEDFKVKYETKYGNPYEVKKKPSPSLPYNASEDVLLKQLEPSGDGSDYQVDFNPSETVAAETTAVSKPVAPQVATDKPEIDFQPKDTVASESTSVERAPAPKLREQVSITSSKDLKNYNPGNDKLAKDFSFGEDVANKFNNIIASNKQLPAKLDQFTSNFTQKVYKGLEALGFNVSSSQALTLANQIENLKKIDEEAVKVKPTQKITDAFSEGDPEKVAAAVVGGLMDLSDSMLKAISTGGVSIFAQPVVESYNSTLYETAEANGTSPLSVLFNDEDKEVVPIITGAISGALEKIGLDKIGATWLKNAPMGVWKKVAEVAKTSGVEGTTEALQTITEQVGEQIANGKDIDVAWNDVLESGIMGMTSGGLAAGPGVTINTSQKKEQPAAKSEEFVPDLDFKPAPVRDEKTKVNPGKERVVAENAGEKPSNEIFSRETDKKVNEQKLPETIGEGNDVVPGKEDSETGEGVTEATETEFKTIKRGKNEYNVKKEDGRLVVVDKSGKEPHASTKTKVIREYEEVFDYTVGEFSKDPQGDIGLDINKLDNHVAETSKNPAEIAETWQQSKASINTEIDYKTQIISDNLPSIGRQSFIDNVDKNEIRMSIAKTYLKKDGVSMDTAAQELSEKAGIEITEQDIWEYMREYPNGFTKSKPTDGQKKLADKFSELTGLELNERTANLALKNRAKKEQIDYESYINQEFYEQDDAEQQFYEKLKTDEKLQERYFQQTRQETAQREPEISSPIESQKKAGQREARREEVKPSKPSQKIDKIGTEKKSVEEQKSKIKILDNELNRLKAKLGQNLTENQVDIFGSNKTQSLFDDKASQQNIVNKKAKELTAAKEELKKRETRLKIAEDSEGQIDAFVEPVSSQKDSVQETGTSAKSEQVPNEPKSVELESQKITFNDPMGISSKPMSGEVQSEVKDAEGKVVAYKVKSKGINYTIKADQINPSDGSMGFIQPTNVLGFNVDIQGTGQKIKKALQKYFTPRGLMPEKMFGKRISMESTINKDLKQMSYTASDFKKAVTKAYGKKVDKKTLSEIDQVLKGDKELSSLPENVAKVVGKMRSQIDRLSQDLIDTGAVQGKMETTLLENLGTYLTRSYKVHDDPKAWKEFLSDNPEGQAIRNRAVNFIRDQYEGKITDDEIAGIVNELLYVPEAPLSVIKGAKLGAKDLGVLRRRKDIAPEIRALLGEYSDPLLNYSKSLVKMAHLLNKHKFLVDIKYEGMGKWFHEKPTEEAFVKIAADSNKTMNPLNGLYTTEELAGVINDFNKKDPPSSLLFKYYMQVNGLAKYAKTVLSIQTHMRNVVGNLFFMTANGHYRLNKIPKAAQIVFNDMASLDKKDFREKYKRYLELGVVFESARAGELQDIIKDASDRDYQVESMFENKIARLKKKTTDIATGLYTAEDDVFKIIAFENEMARYKKAYPDKTQEELEVLSADIVRKTYPTYSLVPEAIKQLRKFPLVGTFVSFPAEVLRTSYNTLELAKNELTDSATRAIGIERSAGILLASTATGAMVAGSMLMNGVDNDEDDDIEHFVAPWAKNGQRIYLGKTANGNFRYVDVSYSDPHSYIKRPINAFIRHGADTDAITESVVQLLSPFLSEDMLAERLIDISRNTTKSGTSVYNPEDALGDKAKDIYEHIAAALEPGSIRNFRRIWMGIHGEVNQYGKSYDPVDEVIALMSGQRIEETNIAQSFSFKMFDASKKLASSKRIYDKVQYNKGNISDKELENARSRSNNALKKNLEEARTLYQAALRLGVSQKELDQILSKTKMTGEHKKIIMGIWEFEPIEK